MATAEELRRQREEQSIFSQLYALAREQNAALAGEGRRPVLGGLLSKEPVQGIDTLRYEGIGNMLAGLLSPAAKAIDAPMSAYQGNIPREDMLGEAFNTAGMATLGGGAVSKLKPRSGSVAPISTQPNPDIENLFSQDVYHYTRSPEITNDVFDANLAFAGNVKDRLGIHVGTQKAAEDRFKAFVGEDMDLARKSMDALNQEGGMTLPLKARMDKPFLAGDGKPFDEFQLSDFINNYADQIGETDRAVVADRLRKDLTDAGYTHVPYINAIEDPNSISAIMLTDRTAGDPAVLRSRYAAFQDEYDPSIMAANASKSAGLLSSSIGGAEANRKVTKEMLDPQRLSKIKMPSHVSEIDYKATPTGDLQQSKTISIDDLQGTTLIPAYGDRTYGGAMLEEIGGTKLNTPVEMQGGHDFMRDQRTGLWASEARAMTPKAEFIDKIIEEGEDPRMVYTAMGGQSADFSHHMADATMGLIEQSKITKKSAKEYDNFVRDKLDPNWPGILDPKARDYLHNNMTGTLRRELWQEMDKDKWKKMGFPHLGLARVAITDPKLLTVDPFSAGLSIGRPTGGGLLDLENKMPHKSYDTQIGGEYLGGLLDQVPGDLIFRDFFKTRRDAGIPTSGDQRSFMMSPYTKQLVDQQMVDEVNQYLDYSRGRM